MTTITRGAVAAGPAGWLRGARFDLFFIFGIAFIAVAGGLAVTLNPNLWGALLLPYLWLIGYPHLISTCTQTSFDRASIQRHRFLMSNFPY